MVIDEDVKRFFENQVVEKPTNTYDIIENGEKVKLVKIDLLATDVTMFSRLLDP